MDSRASILIAQGQNHLFQADRDKTKSLQVESIITATSHSISLFLGNLLHASRKIFVFALFSDSHGNHPGKSFLFSKEFSYCRSSNTAPFKT